jgi:hypothetical protein
MKPHIGWSELEDQDGEEGGGSGLRKIFALKNEKRGGDENGLDLAPH